jgi:hypothetical protein
MSTEANIESESSPSGRFSWLKPKHSEKRDSSSFISSGDPTKDPTHLEVCVAPPVEDSPKPVSFFGLFRSVPVRVPFHLHLNTVPLSFSTRTELILNGFALIAAIAAGAAQVCASILYM